MDFPKEIREAYTKYAHPGPLYYTWVFDPQEAIVEVHDNEGHLLDTPSHHDLAAKYPHPDRIHGYAYRIVGGWRVTDWEHKPLEDPFVLKQVHKALKGHSQKHAAKQVESNFTRFHYGRPLP